MKNVYILHGICDSEEYYERGGSPSNRNWIPWLQKTLMAKGFNCQTPEIPKSYQAKYEDWKNTMALFSINEDTILIGHSAGGGFFLKWLASNQIKIDKLILVAPWKDPFELGNPYDEEYRNPAFLKSALDPDLPKRVNEICVFYSPNDDVKGVKETVDRIMETYPGAKLTTLEGYGHFSPEDMGKTELPEILEAIED